ncbi:MAG: hypothetical protein JJ920_12900 [Roseitalea sp.]|jgi:ribokinase|nr:hypothetical protein [Roseitalea sp.]MBO6720657.1 hypothetical protein [Roseitalea sp.]MBO6743804.1 hypothetical protein [Roseitalea sp.]
MVEIVTTGWLTTDDIVLEDGNCRFGVDGGGALYSAIGASIWNNGVGIHAPAGKPYAEATLAALSSRGFDTQGVRIAEGNGLELWMLHESGDFKQQIVKHTSAKPAEMDRVRGHLPGSYLDAKGFHIAPQGPDSGVDMAAQLRPTGSIVTMDILSDEMIDASAYADLAFLSNLTAFLPSEAEIRRIWNPSNIESWLSQTAVQNDCHLTGKLGENGVLVAEARSGALWHVPAVKADVVDTTGAGDGFCGGFLAGLVAGRSLAESAAMGTVSAAFVVEACGALATTTNDHALRQERFRTAMAGITSIET